MKKEMQTSSAQATVPMLPSIKLQIRRMRVSVSLDFLRLVGRHRPRHPVGIRWIRGCFIVAAPFCQNSFSFYSNIEFLSILNI